MSARCRTLALAVAAATVVFAAAAGAQSAGTGASAATAKGSRQVERGRYVVRIAGCNDCHTPGYAESGGKIAEDKWLTGDALGWRGPWGTTYPPNLREWVARMTEEQWVKYARTAQLRPPMPWWALRDMTEADLRAVYRFVVHLGPGGAPAPAYVPPNQEPKPPYVTFPAPPK
jgi:mono/diheme cytochrome c family protein